MKFSNAELLPTHSNAGRSCSNIRWRERHFFYLIMFSIAVFFIGGIFYLPELKAGTQFAYKRISRTDFLNGQSQSQIKPPYLAPANQLSNNEGFAPIPPNFHSQPNAQSNVPVKDWKPPTILSGEDSDPETRHRRDTVREMTQHAWKSYVKYAWGENELRPVSKRGHSPGIFGSTRMGATIVDSLDTLYIMGLKDEFEQGVSFVKNELNLENIDSEISVFEMNIRFVGGLLTCYAFTKDPIFLTKAEQLAKGLLIAFDTPTGIPNAIVNPREGYSKNYMWASSGCSILSEFGTLHLEFLYLSEVTGNPIYKNKVFAIRDRLDKMNKINGLYPNFLNPTTGQWGQHHFSMGALGDSFYEYLLKAWVMSNGEDVQAKRMYEEAMDAAMEHMLRKSHGGLWYFGDRKYDHTESKMDHLTCFVAGLIGYGARNHSDPIKQETHMEIAKNVTSTCHESYTRSETKVGPESFRFTPEVEARAIQPRERYYMLRPEVIESYFYMWRLTKDKKYRDWAWEATMGLQNHCRTDAGFSGLRNVYDINAPKDDVQQSFLLAETFKYLYLIFSDDSLLSFDEWIFNTEAHPLPIKGRNPAYPIN